MKTLDPSKISVRFEQGCAFITYEGEGEGMIPNNIYQAIKHDNVYADQVLSDYASLLYICIKATFENWTGPGYKRF